MGKKFLNSKEGYNLYASLYDQKKTFLDSFESNTLGRLFQNFKGKKVLDIGCGTGRSIGDLKKIGAEVVAADISEEMLKRAKKKFSDIETVLADICDLPFENESFDAVIAMFLIVHLRNLDEAFSEVYRVIKPGGVFILSNINQRKAPVLKIGKEEILIHSFYHMPKNVIGALEKNWFKVEEEEYIYEEGIWINQIIKAVKV